MSEPESNLFQLDKARLAKKKEIEQMTRYVASNDENLAYIELAKSDILEKIDIAKNTLATEIRKLIYKIIMLLSLVALTLVWTYLFQKGGLFSVYQNITFYAVVITIFGFLKENLPWPFTALWYMSLAVLFYNFFIYYPVTH